MNRNIKALAVAVAAACAAPALADVVEVYTIPTGRDVYYVPSTERYVPAPSGNYYYVPEERYYVAPTTTTTTTTYYTAPASTTYVYTEPAITVEAPRYYNDDQRITADVVDAIASEPRISGNIGVSTFRNNVELTGRVTTPGQRDLAGTVARSVDGVDEVTNLIKPRVGSGF
jgi:hypothetical protein